MSPSIFILHFDSIPPPPFAQVHRGGCYRENFFYFFLFSFGFLFRLCFFRLSYLIISTRLKFVILYSILLFRLSIVLTCYKFRSIFLVCSSLCFTRITFDLFQHCRFCVLALLLVINKHLCLYKFVLCLFWLF